MLKISGITILVFFTVIIMMAEYGVWVGFALGISLALLSLLILSAAIYVNERTENKE